MISIHLVAWFIGLWARQFWEKSAVYVKEYRIREGIPRELSETEYLNYELMKYIKEHPELAT